MITMRLKGGLGNQLFQYAAAYALSKRLNQPFQVDFALSRRMTQSQYKLNLLNIPKTRLVSGEELPKKIALLKSAYVNKALRMLRLPKHRCGNWLYWLETSDAFQKDFFTVSAESLYVDGYFQSEAYFGAYRAELLKQFVPAYPPEPAYTKALQEIRSCCAVAVHARRGDFQRSSSPFHYLLGEAYYRRAIEYVRERVDHPTFFCFSDDQAWAGKCFGHEPDFRFIHIQTTHRDIDDMMLMKNCRHIITANSTFSWWAAWLNEHEKALRIVPEKPFGMEGMIPEGWIKIPVV